jgi:hypothetical protein
MPLWTGTVSETQVVDIGDVIATGAVGPALESVPRLDPARVGV